MSPVDARDRLSRRREAMRRKAAEATMKAASHKIHPKAHCLQESASASFEGLICPCKENLIHPVQDIPSNRLIARVVRPGMILFLFEQSLGRLYGVYQVGASKYDEKISLHVQQRYLPLEGVELENFFLNNDIKPHVGPEVLTSSQVSRLIDMFVKRAEAESRLYSNGAFVAEHMYKDPYARPNPYAFFCPYPEDVHVVENQGGDGGYVHELDEPAHIGIPYAQMAPTAVPHSHSMTSGWNCSPIDSTPYVTHPMKNQGRMADSTPVQVLGYPRQAHLARSSGPAFFSPVAHLDHGNLDGTTAVSQGGYGQPPPYRAHHHHPAEVSYQPASPEASAKGYEDSPAAASRNNNVFHQVEGAQNRAPKQVSKLPKSLNQHPRQQRVNLASNGHQTPAQTTTKAVQSKVLPQKRQKPTKDNKSVFNRIKPATVFSRLGSSSGGNDTIPATEKVFQTGVLVPDKFRPRPPRNQSRMKVDNVERPVPVTFVQEDDSVTGNSGSIEDSSFPVDFKRRVVSSNVSSAPQLKRRKIVRPEGLGCSSENAASLKGQEAQESVEVMSLS
ncbi:uncharacterized protein LOC112343469 [Selaginella moellendorffii]|uniref:uncharacterized protein LOC112343469 n=1 Tax=Selaginella moellendorffii TaxID=88036 RepID=UPI000D1C9190|nr:uncharacterized protein LOC112343469 [Selaginella moellendorffii]|eukprot:XP_024522743.1 uncharacterized protein LOC112343469 [Selaginella moellendorffii]